MIEVSPDGTARIVAANDSAPRKARREDVAHRTSTPDGLRDFMDEHGDNAGRLLHDAMFGPDAARETPSNTVAGRVAAAWKDRRP
jgi:hypothetical protein